MSFSLIFASTPQGAIGYEKNGKYDLPWSNKDDMVRFKTITTRNSTKAKNILIMGKHTYKSIGCLPNRITIVVTSRAKEKCVENAEKKFDNLYYELTLENALNIAYTFKNSYIFVIGGTRLIEEAFLRPDLETVYYSLIYGGYHEKIDNPIKLSLNGFFDTIHSSSPSSHEFSNLLLIKCLSNQFSLSHCDSSHNQVYMYTFTRTANNEAEKSYLDFLKKIQTEGISKVNRTNLKTLSIWGHQLRIDLSKGFPLLTTKYVDFNIIAKEMLFFLSGKTDTTILENQGVNIWKPNTSREFLDKRGLTDYKVGEMGPGYGFQLRHFGAIYFPNHQLAIGEGGVDQVQYVIDGIRAIVKNPSDERGRRLLINLWNPCDLPKMALPCCHYSVQFSVQETKLNSLVNMRSVDTFLGLPFNLVGYALLTHMIAHVVGLEVGKLVFSLADCHLYENCLEQTQEQLTRAVRELPTLRIVKKHESIDDFTIDSLEILNYHSHPPLRASMAV